MRYAIALATTLSIAACSSCSSSPESVPEPARDASADTSARQDAEDVGDGRDGGGVGDGSDAADAAVTDYFPGVWNPLPGATTPCPLKVAANAAASVPKWTWAACPNRAGCQTLVANWSSLDLRKIDFPTLEPIKEINGKRVVIYLRNYPRPGGFAAYATVVQPLDGDPVFAIGRVMGPAICGELIDANERGIYLAIAAGSTLDGGTREEFFASSEWAAPQQVTVGAHFSANDYRAAWTQSLTAGAGVLYLGTYGPNSVSIYDLTSKTFRVPTSPARLPGELPIVVPDGALVDFYTAPQGFALLKPDASYARLVTPTGAARVTNFTVDRASSNAIVWVETEDKRTLSLWTSPYATTAAGIVARRVTTVTDGRDKSGADMIANAGVAVFVTAADVTTIVRLSDGKRWSVKAEPGEVFGRPLWVDDNELLVVTAKDDGPNPLTRASGILRIARSSLGAPTGP